MDKKTLIQEFANFLEATEQAEELAGKFNAAMEGVKPKLCGMALSDVSGEWLKKTFPDKERRAMAMAAFVMTVVIGADLEDVVKMKKIPASPHAFADDDEDNQFDGIGKPANVLKV